MSVFASKRKSLFSEKLKAKSEKLRNILAIDDFRFNQVNLFTLKNFHF